MDAAYAYLAVLALLWWSVLEPSLGFDGRMYSALAATGLLTVLFTLCLAREATRGNRAENQRRNETFRRHVYDLCAGLILGLKMCEYYSEQDPQRLRSELTCLREGVHEFTREEFASPASGSVPKLPTSPVSQAPT
jgi:hypothetical protein